MEEKRRMAYKETKPSIPSCQIIEKLNFVFIEIGGLCTAGLSEKDFGNRFGVDWNSKDINGEIISEILIDFVGK